MKVGEYVGLATSSIAQTTLGLEDVVANMYQVLGLVFQTIL